jgi:diacylglycerol kinase (ATP)
MRGNGPRRHLHIVLNPKSGSGAGRRARVRLEAALGSRVEYVIEETRGRGHAVDLAARAAQAGAPIIVAAGGDGTIHEVVNGLFQSGSEAALGLVPVGTGNDFVKNVPGTRKQRTAWETLVHGVPRAYDAAVARWAGSEEFFVNAAGTGIDVEVVRQIEALRGMPGAVKYMLGLARALGRYRPVRLRVTPAEEPALEREVMLAAVSNGRCLGGAFRLSPRALADDGLLDLCIVESVGLATAVHLAPRILRGTHESHRRVLVRRGTAFTIEAIEDGPIFMQLDGELRRMDSPAIDLQILPGRLSVLSSPPTPAGTD